MLEWVPFLLQALAYTAHNCLTTKTPGTAFNLESFNPESFTDLNIATPQSCFIMGDHALAGWATSNKTHSGDALTPQTYVIKANLLLPWDDSSQTDVHTVHGCLCSISHAPSHLYLIPILQHVKQHLHGLRATAPETDVRQSRLSS